MSNIAIKGATTGTGVFTIESPATNTDRTLTLPDEAGTVLTSGGPISVGGLVTLTNGGIKFPASQVASSDANTLDDYEEGTWTPSVVGSSTNPTISYTEQYGYYTKIGNFVHAFGRITIASISGGSGYFFVDGLPFVVGLPVGRYATGSMGYVGNWVTISPMVIIAPGGGTRFEMYGASSTSARDGIGSIISISNAQAGSQFIFSLTYTV